MYIRKVSKKKWVSGQLQQTQHVLALAWTQSRLCLLFQHPLGQPFRLNVAQSFRLTRKSTGKTNSAHLFLPLQVLSVVQWKIYRKDCSQRNGINEKKIVFDQALSVRNIKRLFFKSRIRMDFFVMDQTHCRRTRTVRWSAQMLKILLVHNVLFGKM